MKRKRIILVVAVLAIMISVSSVTALAASGNGIRSFSELTGWILNAEPGKVTVLPDGGKVYYQEGTFENGIIGGSGITVNPGVDISDEALTDASGDQVLGELQGSFSVTVNDGEFKEGTFPIG